jgi:hypothetical protein
MSAGLAKANTNHSGRHSLNRRVAAWASRRHLARTKSHSWVLSRIALETEDTDQPDQN